MGGSFIFDQSVAMGSHDESSAGSILATEIQETDLEASAFAEHQVDAPQRLQDRNWVVSELQTEASPLQPLVDSELAESVNETDAERLLPDTSFVLHLDEPLAGDRDREEDAEIVDTERVDIEIAKTDLSDTAFDRDLVNTEDRELNPVVQNLLREMQGEELEDVGTSAPLAEEQQEDGDSTASDLDTMEADAEIAEEQGDIESESNDISIEVATETDDAEPLEAPQIEPLDLPPGEQDEIGLSSGETAKLDLSPEELDPSNSSSTPSRTLLYVLPEDESLEELAERFNISPRSIEAINDPDDLIAMEAGDEINLPWNPIVLNHEEFSTSNLSNLKLARLGGTLDNPLSATGMIWPVGGGVDLWIWVEKRPNARWYRYHWAHGDTDCGCNGWYRHLLWLVLRLWVHD